MYETILKHYWGNLHLYIFCVCRKWDPCVPGITDPGRSSSGMEETATGEAHADLSHCGSSHNTIKCVSHTSRSRYLSTSTTCYTHCWIIALVDSKSSPTALLFRKYIWKCSFFGWCSGFFIDYSWFWRNTEVSCL